MSTIDGSRVRRGLAITVLGLFAVACSPAAPVSTSPSASIAPSAPASTAPSAPPSISPTPSPTAAASASAAAAADPAIGLKITAPYTLRVLAPAVETAFRQQFMASAGAFGSLIGVGGREIVKDGAAVGFLFVIGFPTGVMNDAAYTSMVTGLEQSAGTTFTTKTIAGTEVSTGTSATSNMGVYRDGDRVFILITPSAPAIPALAEALIKAN